MPRRNTDNIPKRHLEGEGIRAILDLEGMIFGQLKVLTLTHRRPPTWQCKCACGNEVLLRTYKILEGTRSCGCLSKSRRNKKQLKQEAINKGKHFAPDDELYFHVRNMILFPVPSNIEE